MLLLCLASLLALAACQTPALQLWPMPQSVSCSQGSLAVDSAFAVVPNVNSATLNAAVVRYSAIYAQLVGSHTGTLRKLSVTVTGNDETLSPATNYS
jgi:hypothetical protein